MNREPHWPLAAPLLACLGLAALLAWSSLPAARVGLAALGYLVLYVIVYTDAIDFAIRRYVHHRTIAARSPAERASLANVSIDLMAIHREGGRVRPYAIVASVFDFEQGIDAFVTAFAAYRDHVWLISDGSGDATLTRFRQEGWRCIDDGINRGKPGAIKRLLGTLPPDIETVMVIDPDVRIRQPGEGSVISLEHAIRDFQRSGAGALAPRIMIERDGFLGRFQAFEYALSFGVGRLSLGDFAVTSGVALYRRDALERALDEHSLSIYAEDLENSVLLLSRGERIYYDGRLVLSTDGVGSWQRWFSQRVGWYCGLLKVYTERLQRIWSLARRTPFAMYNYVAYLGVASLGLHLVKLVSVGLLTLSLANGAAELLGFSSFVPGSITLPHSIAIALCGYLLLAGVALVTVVPAGERGYVAPVVPLYLFYAMLHVVPMTVGFANWIAMRHFHRRLYRDHYSAGPVFGQPAYTAAAAAGRVRP